MGKVLINEATLSSIASAIRFKNKSAKWYKPSEMAEAIKKLPNYGDYNQGSIVDASIVDKSISGEYVNNDVEKIGEYAFYNCEHLTKISCESVKEVGDYAFHWANALEEVNLSKAEKIGKNAFYNCNSLKEISLPSVKTLERNCFAYSDIEKATFDNLTLLGNNIWVNASDSPFYLCTKLKELNLPNLSHLSGRALFYTCTNLKELRLPKASSIGELALDSDYLTDIYVPWAEGAVTGAPWGATKATIHYNYTE